MELNAKHATQNHRVWDGLRKTPGMMKQTLGRQTEGEKKPQVQSNTLTIVRWRVKTVLVSGVSGCAGLISPPLGYLFCRYPFIFALARD